MDVFHDDAFSSISLTQGILKVPYNPVGLGALNLFTEVPVRDQVVMIEQSQGKLMVIPTSERGTSPTPRPKDKRSARFFKAPRLAHKDTIWATELQGVRAFMQPGTGLPQVTVKMQLQEESARRLSGPTGLQASLEFTRERHRLSAVQGVLRDADDTVLFNWFQEFGITQPAPFVFNLAAKVVGTLRPLCNQIDRVVRRKSQGMMPIGAKVWGMCGDEFWDAFISHPDVVDTYKNWTAAAQLRNDPIFGAFGQFEFGGITWFNYRGSDDGTTISVGTNSVSFFPVGAPGIFQEVLTPAEFLDWVNKPGLKEYVLPILDMKRKAFFEQEIYTYPLMICTMPEVLQTGTMDDSADIPAEPDEP
jgi:hypothetical protein